MEGYKDGEILGLDADGRLIQCGVFRPMDLPAAEEAQGNVNKEREMLDMNSPINVLGQRDIEALRRIDSISVRAFLARHDRIRGMQEILGHTVVHIRHGSSFEAFVGRGEASVSSRSLPPTAEYDLPLGLVRLSQRLVDAADGDEFLAASALCGWIVWGHDPDRWPREVQERHEEECRTLQRFGPARHDGLLLHMIELPQFDSGGLHMILSEAEREGQDILLKAVAVDPAPSNILVAVDGSVQARYSYTGVGEVLWCEAGDDEAVALAARILQGRYRQHRAAGLGILPLPVQDNRAMADSDDAPAPC